MSENAELTLQQPMDNTLTEIMPTTQNLLQNSKALNQIFKLAKMYSNSDMVPATYRNKPDNCFVALELASRMDVSPVLVMQNLYIVRGKPSWAGQACKALIDGCGKFEKSEYITSGTVADGTASCYLQAVNRTTGKLVKGPEVSLKMAANEGWLNKDGSKWKTMPELMLRYRAAAFFARTECPEALMGFQTAEEVQDVQGYEKEKAEKKIVSIST